MAAIDEQEKPHRDPALAARQLAACDWSEAAIFGDTGSPDPATLSIQNGSILEGEQGNTNLRLDVRLSNTSDQTISVAWRTVDGTALCVVGKGTKADYGAASGTLTFQPGETSKTITISIKPDRTPEPDEVFYVELFDAVGATISDAVATATILNDD